MAVNKKAAGLVVIRPSGKKQEPFFQQVYLVVRQIPKGRVSSYGAIARCLGAALSARMVGWAMSGAGNIKPRVPAHRVVNRNGMLTAKHQFEDSERMQQLLEKEGIKIKNDQVLQFDQVFWDPCQELI